MGVLTMKQSTVSRESARSLPLVADMGIDDASPFGLQGLRREPVVVLKADAVKQCAAALALAGTRQQIRDPAFAAEFLTKNSSWVDEYRVVHLVERSLWFDGQRDFVMQIMRNPSQIPDNPPAEIQKALAHAYTLHPDATVWYGVPLFGDEKNASGLPIPLTVSQIHDEAERRVSAARDHALRMGWMYRSLLSINRLPQACRQAIRRRLLMVQQTWQVFVRECRQARKDAQIRSRAATRARFEYYRTGRSMTKVPEHTTRIGKIASRAAATLVQMETKLDNSELLTEEFIEQHRFAAAGLAVLPFMALQVMPLFLAPAAVVACDPFLFLELPDEPGKLRLIGHWYWQPQMNGREKLHVHV